MIWEGGEWEWAVEKTSVAVWRRTGAELLWFFILVFPLLLGMFETLTLISFILVLMSLTLSLHLEPPPLLFPPFVGGLLKLVVPQQVCPDLHLYQLTFDLPISLLIH
jgi:hypothetical protein